MSLPSNLSPKGVSKLSHVTYVDSDGNEIVGVGGQIMLVDSDGDEITSFGGSGAGGGAMVYSNAAGDFTATANSGAKTITITGLPFTLEEIHVALGSIKVINTSTDVVEDADLSSIDVSAGVITLANQDSNFGANDEVAVLLVGPTKAYDTDLDTDKSSVQNPDYAHYTSVEHLINEEDLGLDGTHDGGDGLSDFQDTSETYSADNVAEGYEIYNVTDGSDATVSDPGDWGAGDDEINHDALANGGDNDWDNGDVASIPEVKRFVIPFESYRHMSIHYKLVANDAHNSCYMKLYATNNDDADDTADTDWVDVTNDVFGAVQIDADGIGDAAAATEEGIGFITNDIVALKYMIKVVAECDNGTQDNDFDVYIKKAY